MADVTVQRYGALSGVSSIGHVVVTKMYNKYQNILKPTQPGHRVCVCVFIIAKAAADSAEAPDMAKTLRIDF